MRSGPLVATVTKENVDHAMPGLCHRKCNMDLVINKYTGLKTHLQSPYSRDSHLSAILCQDNVTPAVPHRGVTMAGVTNETRKVTSVQTLRQSHHHCSY